MTEAPAIKCVYCKGSGQSPPGSNITCLVCLGKGVVSIQTSKVKHCSDCGGRGRARGRVLPCLRCKGKGVVRA